MLVSPFVHVAEMPGLHAGELGDRVDGSASDSDNVNTGLILTKYESRKSGEHPCWHSGALVGLFVPSARPGHGVDLAGVSMAGDAPADAGTGWRARAIFNNTFGFTNTVTLTVYAICAPIP
jgi:hypothetical protein